MDGLVSKFLSVLKAVADDNNIQAKQETDELKEKTGDAPDNVQENGINNARGEVKPNTVEACEETEPQASPNSESSLNSSSNLQDDLTNSSLSDPPDDEPRVEQCIDIVPVEDMPLPSPASQVEPSSQGLQPGYTPSLAHSPSQGVLQRDPPSSPSLFDRSIEFFKREFDSLRFSLGTRPILTHEEWFNIFNADGQMLDTEKFYSFLLDYDWPAELLQEGWKYSFQYYETFSNHDERVLIDKDKETELEKLVAGWSEILEKGEENCDENARVQKLIYLINKDVPRTDRDHPFYTGNPDNSSVLRDLLVTFCFANPDIGYVQGMNEVLSMFLVTVENKTVAYWGYSNYTLRNKLFFNSTGLMAKLNGVAELLNIHDPDLYSKLRVLDCSNMLFCQRWILLGFKRECKTFEMAVKVFTIINSLKPTHYIQLQGLGKCELLSLDMFLVVAVLMSSRNTLLSFSDQTDVYQWTGKLKLSDMSAISHARQMYDEWANRNW